MSFDTYVTDHRFWQQRVGQEQKAANDKINPLEML